MSFMRGGDDEGVHERHHARVVRGIVWDGLGKGKGKAAGQGAGGHKGEGAGQGWRVVQDDVCVGSVRGRIVMLDGSWGGNKVSVACHFHERYIRALTKSAR
jgi:N-acetyltransferase